MAFANFYVAESEITKQFKGCYRQEGPSSTTVGTLTGAWISTGVKDIIPVSHTSIPNLWVFPGTDGTYIKMVGMNYDSNGGPPTRVDGRAYSITQGSSTTFDSENVSNYWDNATDKNIGPDDYSLSISNNSPLKSVNTCLQNANSSDTSVFSVSDVNKNGLGYCSTGDNVKTPQGTLMSGVDEAQCLQMPTSNTVYTLNKVPGSENTLGKTYLGKKEKESNKMVFHEYPSSLLSLSKRYNKYSGYDSNGSDLTNGEIKDASSEECKQYCLNKGDECKGFVYNSTENTCYLKSKIYPNVEREINKSADIYTRMPKVSNSPLCPKGVKAVPANFINKGGFLSSDQMSMDFQCESEAALKEDEASIEKAYTTLTEEVSGLREENDRILKGFNDVRSDINKKSKDYHKNEKKMRNLKNNPTLEKLLLDSEQLQSVFSLRNTGFVLALLLLSIFLVRVLRK